MCGRRGVPPRLQSASGATLTSMHTPRRQCARVSLPSIGEAHGQPHEWPQELEVTFKRKRLELSGRHDHCVRSGILADGSTAVRRPGDAHLQGPRAVQGALGHHGLARPPRLRDGGHFGSRSSPVTFRPGFPRTWERSSYPAGQRPEGNCISVFASGKEIALAEDHFHFVCQAKSGAHGPDVKTSGGVRGSSLTGARGGV
jgi:hypothetical protein